eukprot:Filipodium_phascolosomae@DN6072_c0_g1_i1.p1
MSKLELPPEGDTFFSNVNMVYTLEDYLSRTCFEFTPETLQSKYEEGFLWFEGLESIPPSRSNNEIDWNVTPSIRRFLNTTETVVNYFLKEVCGLEQNSTVVRQLHFSPRLVAGYR